MRAVARRPEPLDLPPQLRRVVAQQRGLHADELLELALVEVQVPSEGRALLGERVAPLRQHGAVVR